jgi:hypothetical protein
MLVGAHDGVAPDSQLIGQAPARRQPQSGNEPAVENRATQTGVYLQRLIADCPVQPKGYIEDIESTFGSGWRNWLSIGPRGDHLQRATRFKAIQVILKRGMQ